MLETLTKTKVESDVRGSPPSWCEGLRRVFKALVAWLAMFACADAGWSLYAILFSEEIMSYPYWLRLIVVLGFFGSCVATIAIGAMACHYTIPTGTHR
jgi:hypothetical protein